jgi:MEMO1 family protein
MSTRVRAPAVAGMFYPADQGELQTMIAGFLHGKSTQGGPPKAIVVPHAGYIYSGPIAATAYAQLRPLRDRITRVVLLGPSHRVALRGIAAPTAEFFATPLGTIPIDRTAIAALMELGLSQVGYQDSAHALEHSLEVQLPFLQTVLANFTLVPLVVGEASPAQVAQVLKALWGGAETLVVISTDLSHYHRYNTARQLDSSTAKAIERLDYEHIHGEDACGCHPLNGLLYLAQSEPLHITTLDLRNSGDTAGPKDQVVGYGAFMVISHAHH